jgi:hypothetical protein
MKDLHNNIKVARVISPISPSATGTISGQPVDLNGFEKCEFVIAAGAQTTTGITATPIVKEGAATGSLSAVADADLLGTEAAAALDGTAGANNQSNVGYKGNSRYATCDLVVAGAATGVYSVVAVLSGARKAPVT